MNYFREYLGMSASESGFVFHNKAAEDLTHQRRNDRKKTLGFYIGLIHNPMLLYG